MKAEKAFPGFVKYKTPCAERGGPFADEPGAGSNFACLNSFPRAAGNPATKAEATNLPRGDVPFGLSSAPPELDHMPLHLPDSPQLFRVWLLSFLRISGSARVGLSAFLAESFKPCCPTACNAQLGSNSGKSLWPCPPPRRWTEHLRHYSPRRRRKMRELQLIHDLLRVAIGTLNWIALGSPLHCPAEARAGMPVSADQLDMQCVLERHIKHFVRAPSFESSLLGRSEDRFAHLLSLAQELPKMGNPLSGVDLRELVCELQSSWDDYGSGSAPAPAPACKPPKTTEPNDVDSQCVTPASNALGSCKVSASTHYKEVVASRIKWEHPPSFNPIPYLPDPVVRAAFINPDTLRKPPETWPSLPAAQVRCSKSELIALAYKWDSLGALKIIPCDSIDSHEAVGLFAISKDRSWDRLILNPTVVNSRNHGYSHYTKYLAPGCLLGQTHLEPDQCLRLSCDDLSEFYYTFQVPHQRATRNAIRMPLPRSAVQGFKAFHHSLGPGPFYVCLATMAMGDSLAVEVAQQSHHTVLATLANAMRPSEIAAYRAPYPRGPTAEYLAVDDHLVAQKVTFAEHRQQTFKRDTEIFRDAERAYTAVRLVQHPRKRKRNESSGVYLGADVDGLAGLVSAPRHRIGVLMLITAEVARRGCCSASMLSSLLGLWVHVLMFRRPAFSLLSSCFQDACHVPRDLVFQLGRKTLNELQSLSLLAPLFQADLRVSYLPFIFCMDASPGGAGLCVADAPVHVAQELWRHTEQKGYYTRLGSPAAALLREQGFNCEATFGPDDIPPAAALSGFTAPVPRHLFEGLLFDTVELFSGEGNWSSAHRAAGLETHPGIDLAGRSLRVMDILDDTVFHEVLSLALRRVVREWHGAPPCLTFGTLRRPRLRSKLRPHGFNPNDPLTRKHNRMAQRTGFLFCVVARLGGFFVWNSRGHLSCSDCTYLSCLHLLVPS